MRCIASCSPEFPEHVLCTAAPRFQVLSTSLVLSRAPKSELLVHNLQQLALGMTPACVIYLSGTELQSRTKVATPDWAFHIIHCVVGFNGWSLSGGPAPLS